MTAQVEKRSKDIEVPLAVANFMNLGFSEEWAMVLWDEDVDYDKIKSLLDNGCTLELAMRIML